MIRELGETLPANFLPRMRGDLIEVPLPEGHELRKVLKRYGFLHFGRAALGPELKVESRQPEWCYWRATWSQLEDHAAAAEAKPAKAPRAKRNPKIKPDGVTP